MFHLMALLGVLNAANVSQVELPKGSEKGDKALYVDVLVDEFGR